MLRHWPKGVVSDVEHDTRKRPYYCKKGQNLDARHGIFLVLEAIDGYTTLGDADIEAG